MRGPEEVKTLRGALLMCDSWRRTLEQAEELLRRKPDDKQLQAIVTCDRGAYEMALSHLEWIQTQLAARRAKRAERAKAKSNA